MGPYDCWGWIETVIAFDSVHETEDTPERRHPVVVVVETTVVKVDAAYRHETSKAMSPLLRYYRTLRWAPSKLSRKYHVLVPEFERTPFALLVCRDLASSSGERGEEKTLLPVDVDVQNRLLGDAGGPERAFVFVDAKNDGAVDASPSASVLASVPASQDAPLLHGRAEGGILRQLGSPALCSPPFLFLVEEEGDSDHQIEGDSNRLLDVLELDSGNGTSCVDMLW